MGMTSLGLMLDSMIVVTITCLLSTLVQAKELDHRKEKWLADESFYDVQPDSDGFQSDSRFVPISVDLCPPVPQVLPLGGCEVEVCGSDRQCGQLKCCYNGCVYTCLPEIKAAPHFDWFREPRRRFRSGRSWLVPGAEDIGEVEMCSTTLPKDDSDMLLCPHGYKCSIISEGNPNNGIPNRGICVKQRMRKKKKRGKNLGLKISPIKTSRKPSHISKACALGDGQVLLNGHNIQRNRQNCICRDSKLICRSPKATS